MPALRPATEAWDPAPASPSLPALVAPRVIRDLAAPPSSILVHPSPLRRAARPETESRPTLHRCPLPPDLPEIPMSSPHPAPAPRGRDRAPRPFSPASAQTRAQMTRI